jgi:hypothetical protein
MQIMKATLTTAALLLLCLAQPPVTADESESTHLLRYQFVKGELIQWKVIHLGTTETKIQGNTQTSKSRSVSTKAWQVNDVGADGNFTFSHTVTNVNMWQQLSDRPEVRYNSETDTEIPAEYQQVAKTIGIPLATVTVSPRGEIVDREGSKANEKFGVGGIVMLLPEKPIKAGSRWYEPSELHTRLPDGRVKKIKIRKGSPHPGQRSSHRIAACPTADRWHDQVRCRCWSNHLEGNELGRDGGRLQRRR